jgi:hypothetical protein
MGPPVPVFQLSCITANAGFEPAVGMSHTIFPRSHHKPLGQFTSLRVSGFEPQLTKENRTPTAAAIIARYTLNGSDRI